MAKKTNPVATETTAPSKLDAVRALIHLVDEATKYDIVEKNKAFKSLGVKVLNDKSLTKEEKDVVLTEMGNLLANGLNTASGFGQFIDDDDAECQCGNCEDRDICENAYAGAPARIPFGVPVPNKTYNAKQMMVTPDQMLEFSALLLINMYMNFGMPLLLIGMYGGGISTVTDGITYDMVMSMANDPSLDIVLFTDGNNMANLKP